MAFLLALVLVTLALTGPSPTLTSPVVVWTKPLNSAPSGISVGANGVYVAGGGELRRYDFDGNMVWSKQVVSSPFDSVTGVAVSPRGVYVVGETGDAFVSLYDFDGVMIWTRVFESSSTATSVSADSAAVYVAGAGSAARYTGYMFVTKFDSYGNLLWTQRIADRFATAISIGPKAVYVAEHTQILSQCHDCPYFTDTFFTAVDFQGNTLWDRKINNETLDVECFCSSTLSVGSTGIYVVDNTVLRTPLGQFADVSSISKYDFGGSELWTRFVSSWRASPLIIGLSANSKGVYIPGDGFVQHLDPNGTEVWTLHIGGQVFRTVSVSSRGVFVAGLTSVDRLCASPSCIHN